MSSSGKVSLQAFAEACFVRCVCCVLCVLSFILQVQYVQSMACRMSNVRDLPPVSGSIIWARQVLFTTCISSDVFLLLYVYVCVRECVSASLSVCQCSCLSASFLVCVCIFVCSSLLTGLLVMCLQVVFTVNLRCIWVVILPSVLYRYGINVRKDAFDCF